MKKLLISALPALLLSLSLSGQDAHESARPNILWIITDDQRADALECYNRATTGKNESSLGYVMSPNIDKLAEEGVLFTAAFCNSPMCAPSRGSMHSGRYPFRSGHYFYQRTHQEADFVRPTVSQSLRKHGYGTAVFGKTHWVITKHLDGKANKDEDFFDHTVHFQRDLERNGFGAMSSRGHFEFPEGILSAVRTEETIRYPDGREKSFITQLRDAEIPEEDQQTMKEVDEEFEILRAYTRLNKSLILGGENPFPAGETVDANIVKELKSYLENAGKPYKTMWGKEVTGADPDKPLFINLGFHLPHTPVLPPKKYRDIFKKKKYNIPEFSTDELSNFPPQLVVLYNECKTDQFKPEEKLQAIQDYYAFCAYGDELIGEAVDAFKAYCKERGQEYLIVFTVGDHGWHLGEQGIMAKFGPWKQSIHDAAIVVSSDKEKYPAGKVFNEMVEFVDFAPTMMAAAGIDINKGYYDYLDGYDLARVLRDESLNREYVIGELNVVCGHRGFLRTEDFAFSMRTRDKWGAFESPDLNRDVTWALTCDAEKADLAMYDLRQDPLEKNNVAYSLEYKELAAWFRNKLGTIVLGDGRVECDWTKPNSYSISNFAGGADDKKIDIPPEIIPAL